MTSPNGLTSKVPIESIPEGTGFQDNETRYILSRLEGLSENYI